VAENPTDWDLYADTVTYAYNTQVHRATNCTPFELTLSRPPQPFAVEPTSQGRPKEKPKQFMQRWKTWLQHLMRSARNELRKHQLRYQRNFNARTKAQQEPLESGDYVFVRKEYYSTTEKKHKLAPIADGPFKVLKVDAHTVTVQVANATEKVSRDRVVEAPHPESHVTETSAPTQGRRQVQ